MKQRRSKTVLQPTTSRVRHGPRRLPLRLECLEDRTLLAGHSFATATVLNLMTSGAVVKPPAQQLLPDASGQIAPDFYAIDAPFSGQLRARVHAPGLATRLTLLNARHQVIVQSDGQSVQVPDNLILQHIDGAATKSPVYFLEVEALGRDAGAFTLTAQLTDANAPNQALLDSGPVDSIVVGDFNRDHLPDIAEVEPGVNGRLITYLSRGDGTFQEKQLLTNLGGQLSNLVAGDFDGNGDLSLAVTSTPSGGGYGGYGGYGYGYSGSNNPKEIILHGDGSGSFTTVAHDLNLPPIDKSLTIPLVAVADVNGDGKQDLVIDSATNSKNALTVYFSMGGGSFTTGPTLTLEGTPKVLASDGKQEIVLVDTANRVTILHSDGHGGLQVVQTWTLPATPLDVLVQDLNNHHLPDLAVLTNTSQVLVYINQAGHFATPSSITLPALGSHLAAADFNGDGHIDLAVSTTTGISVFLGKGDGTFPEERDTPVKGSPTLIATGDFNNDGRVDVAFSTSPASGIFVVNGLADGTFQNQLRTTGTNPSALAFGDFNGDGVPDLVSVNQYSDDISVFLGVGDGTFQEARRIKVGFQPSAVAVGDFNGDGRQDIAVLNSGDQTISILLGIGDGTFQSLDSLGQSLLVPVSADANSLVTGDFNGDGILDLATVDQKTGMIEVFRGKGDGTFFPALESPAVPHPSFLVAADFNGDNKLDLAMGYFNGDPKHPQGGVAVMFGLGNGTFTAPTRYPVRLPVQSTGINDLVVGDFNGDGKLDLAASSGGYYAVDPASNPLETGVGLINVFLGNGKGGFQPLPDFTDTKGVPQALIPGHFDTTGDLELLATHTTYGGLLASIGGYLSYGGFGSGPAASYPGPVTVLHIVRTTIHETPPAGLPELAGAVAATDFNGDRLDDVAATDGQALNVFLNTGGGFASPGSGSNPIHANPLFADLTGDGIADAIVLDQAGNILFRAGRPEAGSFDPAILVNPGTPVRDIAIVHTGGQAQIVGISNHGDALVLFTRQGNGTFTEQRFPVAPGAIPIRIAAADLNQDGLGDVVVLNAGTQSLSIFPDVSLTGFSQRIDIPLGFSGSDLELVNDNHGIPQIYVADQVTGEVAVVHNLGAYQFSPAVRYAAGPGPYGLQVVQGARTPFSADLPTGLAVGDFNGDGQPDLVVTDAGSRQFKILDGTSAGGFTNPDALLHTTQQQPGLIRVGDFNGDGHLDLAILEGSSVEIFLGDGAGNFTSFGLLDAGNDPTGLTIADVNSDGKQDLVIGNAFGDLLVLLGNGDGTFQAYRRVDQKVGLGVSAGPDLQANFVLSNEAADQVLQQNSLETNGLPVLERQNGLLSPGQVQVADLNGDGIPDLIVVNSGANQVLVYFSTGKSQYDLAHPHAFFTGTDPVSVTVAALDDDLVLDPATAQLVDPTPDLVVSNEGSNDLTILYGVGSGANWTLQTGPRLALRGPNGQMGIGPVSTTVIQGSNGNPSIFVTNRGSNNVFMLPGVGRGFFNDQNPFIFNTGAAPVASFVGNFDGNPGLDLVTIDSGANGITLFSGFGPAEFIALAGEDPEAGVQVQEANGASDLFVADNADGIVDLLFGGNSALRRSETEELAGLHPTDLALLDLGGLTNVYVANEGQDRAMLLTSFTLGMVPGLPGSDIPALAQDDQQASTTTEETITENSPQAVSSDVATASILNTLGLIGIPLDEFNDSSKGGDDAATTDDTTTDQPEPAQIGIGLPDGANQAIQKLLEGGEQTRPPEGKTNNGGVSGIPEKLLWAGDGAELDMALDTLDMPALGAEQAHAVLLSADFSIAHPDVSALVRCMSQIGSAANERVLDAMYAGISNSLAETHSPLIAEQPPALSEPIEGTTVVRPNEPAAPLPQGHDTGVESPRDELRPRSPLATRTESSAADDLALLAGAAFLAGLSEPGWVECFSKKHDRERNVDRTLHD